MASMTSAPGAADGGGRRGSGQRGGRRPQRRGAASSPAGEALDVGVAGGGDHHGVAAGEDRDGVDERARGRLVEQIGEDDDQRALAAADRAERELVVAVALGGLEVEESRG